MTASPVSKPWLAPSLINRAERLTLASIALNWRVLSSVTVVLSDNFAVMVPLASVLLLLAVIPTRPPSAATASERAEVPPSGTEVVASTERPPAIMVPLAPTSAITVGVKLVLGSETPTAARPAAYPRASASSSGVALAFADSVPATLACTLVPTVALTVGFSSSVAS